MKKYVSLLTVLAMGCSAAIGASAETMGESYATLKDETVKENLKESAKQQTDIKKDEDFLNDSKAFGNKYVYNVELQDKMFVEKYPDVFEGALSYKENKDGTVSDVSLSMYVDADAAMMEKHEIVFFDGKLKVNDSDETDGLIFKDRMLVCADVFEKLGCEVETDDEAQVTTIAKDGKVIEIMPYLLAMRKDKEEGYWVPLEICARYVGEEKAVYVPLRAVAEELGLSVEWDNDLHMAVLNG